MADSYETVNFTQVSPVPVVATGRSALGTCEKIISVKHLLDNTIEIVP